jgi:hypothetical protein
VLGTDKEIKEMGVVPIFELLRRMNLGADIKATPDKKNTQADCAPDGSNAEIKADAALSDDNKDGGEQPQKPTGLKLAAISGKIVIVPNICMAQIKEIAARDNARMRVVPIKETQHSELRFEGSNSAQKIAVITRAFNMGIINGIVGTKSLLGEGWDSPVINTLILGSSVGSFMLSNQMRFRKRSAIFGT